MKKFWLPVFFLLSINAFGQNYAHIPKWILEEKLAQSVFQGDIKTTRELLERGVSIGARDKFGQPLSLLYAYPYFRKYDDSNELFDLLSRYGIDWNARNDFGTTFIIRTCRRCVLNEEERSEYIKKGIDPDVTDIFGGAPYDYEYFGTSDKFPRFAPPEKQFAVDDNTVTWRFLIELGLARIDDYHLLKPYKNSATAAMALAYYHENDLLGDVLAEHYIGERDGDGETVAFYAAQSGCDRCLFGIDNSDGFLDIKNKRGETALIRAAQFGNDYLVLRIAVKGADPDLTDKTGKTALFYAAEYDYFLSVLNLLTRGSDPNFAAPDGNTALTAAAKLGNKQAVSAFAFARKSAENARAGGKDSAADKNLIALFEKIDLNIRNREMKSALMIAAENGNREIVEILLKAGADKSTKDKRGKTAADIAVEKGHKEIYRLLQVG
ncbi:MAG: ankyrin repeat domain-containing protein [Pyrinomonadaceae bacterium]